MVLKLCDFDFYLELGILCKVLRIIVNFLLYEEDRLDTTSR
jgi:hypothetical protein